MVLDNAPTWEASLFQGSELTSIADPSHVPGRLRITVNPTRLWKMGDEGKFRPTEFTFELKVADSTVNDADLVYERKNEANEESALWPVCERAREVLACLLYPTLKQVHELSVKANETRSEGSLEGTDPKEEQREFELLVGAVLPLFKTYLDTKSKFPPTSEEEGVAGSPESCTLLWRNEELGTVREISHDWTDEQHKLATESKQDQPLSSPPTSPKRGGLKSFMASKTFPLEKARQALSSRLRRSSSDSVPPSEGAQQRREARQRLTKEIWKQAREAAGKPSLDLLQV